MGNSYTIITNNPLVHNKLGEELPVIYREVSYEDILKVVRDEVHRGGKLLSHPLSGSIKPKETPYKSVMIDLNGKELDQDSLAMIEGALYTCSKFHDKTELYSEDVYEDFQVIDLGLIESARSSY